MRDAVDASGVRYGLSVYRKDSIKTPGDYLSEIILRVGA